MAPFIRRISEGPNNFPVVGIVVYLIVFILMPPPLEHYMGKYRINNEKHPLRAISENINGTYRSEHYPPHIHESKLTFRVVPAFIGKLSPSKNMYVQIFFLYCIQLVMGLMFTILLLQWLTQVAESFTFAVLMTLGFMLTHLGSSFTYDMSFFFDGMAFFFMAAAMFSPSVPVFISGILASMWTDERAIIGVAGVLLFKIITSGYLGSARLVLLNVYTVTTALVLLSYVLVRLFLTIYTGMSVPIGDDAGVGFAEWVRQIKVMPLAWLLSFKLYWYYLVPLVVYLLGRSPVVAILSALFILLSLLSTGLVIDIMRSTTYLFPFLLCGIYCSFRIYAPAKNKLIGKMNAIWNIVIPNYRGFEIFYIIIPLPFRIIRLFL